MRGKEADGSVNFDTKRITPTYAGKSAEEIRTSKQRRDHPRLCGEKFASYGTSIAPTGSPPPMRGKDEAFSDQGMTSGITPAYAGKSGKGTD